MILKWLQKFNLSLPQTGIEVDKKDNLVIGEASLLFMRLSLIDYDKSLLIILY